MLLEPQHRNFTASQLPSCGHSRRGSGFLMLIKSRERSYPAPAPSVRRECRFRIAGIAIAILAILLCSSRCFGQSTFGSIRGTVQDVSGAAIPDAQVTLHSVDESTDRVVKTDATGSYTWRM